jgi:hypothetical protein
MTQRNIRIRIRRDTAENWVINNPVLKIGEPGLETNTKRLKFGDGITAWNSLQYSGININDALLLENIDDRVATLIKAGSNISVVYNDNTNELIIGATGLQLSGNYASLINGKVPVSQLPSYIDDVVEYANLAVLPSGGESDKIYITLNDKKTYRWSGSTYIEISASPGSSDAVPEGSGNLYYTNSRASAAAPVQSVVGRTGIITLTASDISDFSSGVSETVDTLLVAGNNIDLSYNDSENSLTVNFSIPVSNIDLHNGGPQSAQVLQFSDATKQSVITGPTPVSGVSSQRIIVQGQRAQGGGEGGDVYIWGGDADTNGGDIKIYAGDADNVSPNNGYGGYVNIDGGNGYTQGGNVSISAGNSLTQGGNVNISAGYPSGSISINTNASSWTFGIDGSTILPENTLKGYCFTATNTVVNYIPQAASFLYTDNPILRLILSIGGSWYIKGPGLVGWKQISAAQDNGGVSLILRIGSGSTPLPDGSEFPSGGGNVYTISQYVEFDLKVADKTWIFKKDGKLTLPIDGDILDSNGTSVLGGSTTVVSSSYSSTINTDAGAGDIFDITLTGNATLSNPTNPVNGKTLRWRITQDATGSHTVALGNKFNIPSSATSPLPFSTTANKMDVLAATYHSGRDKWDIIAFVPGY